MKVLVSEKITVCDSLFKKGFGLMFSRKRSDFAMIFPFEKDRRMAITMCCVFYPIDIIFLDKNKHLVEFVENLKPFKDFVAKNKVRYFIELPAGSVKKFGFKKGVKFEWGSDKLFFQN